MQKFNFKTLLFICVFFVAQSVLSKTLVIADIDDTLRVTNRLKANWLEQLDNARDPSLMFVGMDTILNSLSDEGATVFYVTAAIAPLDELSKKFLKTNQLPQRKNFINKGWFNNTEDFKTETILQLISDLQPTEVILLGDNGEYDSAAYARVAQEFPNTFVFIHKLYEAHPSTPVPSAQSIYLTGADLAVSLEASGLLSSQTTNLVLQQTHEYLATKDTTLLVLPRWAEIVPEDISRLKEQTQQASTPSLDGLSQVFSELGL